MDHGQKQAQGLVLVPSSVPLEHARHARTVAFDSLAQCGGLAYDLLGQGQAVDQLFDGLCVALQRAVLGTTSGGNRGLGGNEGVAVTVASDPGSGNEARAGFKRHAERPLKRVIQPHEHCGSSIC